MARPTSRVTRVEVAGPLAPFVAAYTTRLRERGYTPLSVVNELRQVAHLSRWLQEGGLGVGDLTSQRLDRFLDVRRAGGHGACSVQGLAPLFEVLGPLPEELAPAPISASEVVLGSFRAYLREERGIGAGTAAAYVGYARRFLADHAPDGDLSVLTATDVVGAVHAECLRVSVASAQYFVAGLRSFLRFCFVDGLVAVDLAAAALAVTGRRRSSLPKGIGRTNAMALLSGCDRRRRDGRRDYAILLILLRLGLRAGEVAGLTLDDIDWWAADLVVHGKGGRADRLPLPADVGEAIAGYLRRGRPRSSRREVFLRAIAPVAPLGRGGVSSVVRRACRRVGIEPVGAHRLRHTLACEMVAAGVPLVEISEVLRHRSISSTGIYARVDLDTLRGIALPWPGAELA